DSRGATVDYNALTSLAQIIGGGYLVSIENSEDEGPLENAELRISCLDPAVSTDQSLVLTRASVVASGQSTVSVSSFCSADHPVALGGFGSADGVVLYDRSSAPVWGSEASPQNLDDTPDGVKGPPTGWKTKIASASNGVTAINAFSIC